MGSGPTADGRMGSGCTIARVSAPFSVHTSKVLETWAFTITNMHLGGPTLLAWTWLLHIASEVADVAEQPCVAEPPVSVKAALSPSDFSVSLQATTTTITTTMAREAKPTTTVRPYSPTSLAMHLYRP